MAEHTKAPAPPAPAAKKQPAKKLTDQDRALNFVRLAQRRVSKALTLLAHIERLANRRSYRYTDESAAKIVAALHKAVDSVERAFTPQSSNGQLFAL